MGEWTAEPYFDDSGSSPFLEWMDGLDEITFLAVDSAIRNVLEARGIELSQTSWMTPLGEGLHEFRIRQTAKALDQLFEAAGKGRPKGPNEVLVRIFVHFHGAKICLLLGGYDKQDDASEKRQNREIKLCRQRLAAWRRREAGGGKDSGRKKRR